MNLAMNRMKMYSLVYNVSAVIHKHVQYHLRISIERGSELILGLGGNREKVTVKIADQCTYRADEHPRITISPLVSS